MSFPVKPKQIYHTDEQNTANSNDSWMNEFENMFKTDLGEKVVEETLKQDKLQEFVEPEKVEKPSIDELSYEQKMEFVKKFANEFNLEFTMRVTPAIKEEPTPVVTPTIEPMKEEVVVEPEPVKEEVKVETPKQTEKPITFNFEKPEGWNKKIKKISIFTVIFNGLLGIDIDQSDFRRYEKFMYNFKPVIIILILSGIVIAGFYFKVDDNKNQGKKINIVDRVFNYCVDTYDDWTGRNKKYILTDTIKVYNQDTPVQETFNIDYQPNYLDSINKVDTTKIDTSKTLSDWEKQYQQLNN
jgi:hypothetical protein